MIIWMLIAGIIVFLIGARLNPSPPFVGDNDTIEYLPSLILIGLGFIFIIFGMIIKGLIITWVF